VKLKLWGFPIILILGSLPMIVVGVMLDQHLALAFLIVLLMSITGLYYFQNSKKKIRTEEDI